MTIEKCYYFITFYRFHNLAFDRGDISLECFNRATENYAL